MDRLDKALVLECPRCKGQYTQQGAVEVWNRKGEDADGFFARVETNGNFTHRTGASEAFLGRRDDLRVSFKCESCGDLGALYVVQHKGRTMLVWSDGTPPVLKGQ